MTGIRQHLVQKGEGMAGFDQIIGHTDVVEHLKNAMKMDKVSHAYIFNGEKGCGK